MFVEEHSVELTEKPVEVYNFNVDDAHTYFVGECKVWVHNVECTPATELKTIKKGTKEWDDAVAKLKAGGKGNNFRVETIGEAKELLREGRENMNRYKRCSKAFKEAKKGYSVHSNESNTLLAPHNNLPHIKRKDRLSGDSSGTGHIFFNKT